MIKASPVTALETAPVAGKATALIMALGFAASFCEPVFAAPAEDEFYFGAQLARFNFDQDNVPDLDIPALVLRLGYMLDENFGIEGRLGGGLDEDDSNFNFKVGNTVDRNANWKVKIESFAGIYGVARAEFTESAGVYALVGFTNMSVERTLKSDFTSGSGSDDDASFSFGAGLDYGYTDSFRITLEAMSYMDKDDFSASAVSLGVQF